MQRGSTQRVGLAGLVSIPVGSLLGAPRRARKSHQREPKPKPSPKKHNNKQRTLWRELNNEMQPTLPQQRPPTRPLGSTQAEALSHNDNSTHAMLTSTTSYEHNDETERSHNK